MTMKETTMENSYPPRLRERFGRRFRYRGVRDNPQMGRDLGLQWSRQIGCIYAEVRRDSSNRFNWGVYDVSNNQQLDSGESSSLSIAIDMAKNALDYNYRKYGQMNDNPPSNIGFDEETYRGYRIYRYGSVWVGERNGERKLGHSTEAVKRQIDRNLERRDNPTTERILKGFGRRVGYKRPKRYTYGVDRVSSNSALYSIIRYPIGRRAEWEEVKKLATADWRTAQEDLADYESKRDNPLRCTMCGSRNIHKEGMCEGCYSRRDNPSSNKSISLALSKLQRESEQSTRWRGHTMGDWKYIRPGVSERECINCGRSVTCIVRPSPNEAPITGEALAINCGDVRSRSDNPHISQDYSDTAKYWHVRIRAPHKNEQFRTIEFKPDVKAVIGVHPKTKGPRGGRSDVQKLIFSRDKFGLQDIKKWLTHYGFGKLK